MTESRQTPKKQAMFAYELKKVTGTSATNLILSE